MDEHLIDLETAPPTPAPWYDDGYRIYAPTDAADPRHGRLIMEYKHTPNFRRADARLIRAAPTLFAWFKAQTRDHLVGCGCQQCWLVEQVEQGRKEEQQMSTPVLTGRDRAGRKIGLFIDLEACSGPEECGRGTLCRIHQLRHFIEETNGGEVPGGRPAAVGPEDPPPAEEPAEPDPRKFGLYQGLYVFGKILMLLATLNPAEAAATVLRVDAALRAADRRNK